MSDIVTKKNKMLAKVNFPGSKNGSGIYQNIINLFPKHNIYIEPFLGSGSILKRKLAAGINIGLDINSSFIDKFDSVPGFFFSPGDSLIFLDAAASLINALHDHGSKILIYCDPPYPIETRRSGSKLYKYEFSQDHHKLFLDAVLKLNCYVMISCYENDLYNLALSGWNKLDMHTVTRHSKATERIYFNYLNSLPKHQYDFIGNNFRERAAKKGRVYRNVSKILKMPADEQTLLMDLLSKKILIVS